MAEFHKLESVAIPLFSIGQNGQFPLNDAVKFTVECCLKWYQYESKGRHIKLIKIYSQNYAD